ncbi:protein-export chaperone SecB [Cecembia rubra]|uniref:Preprotein translocase subunit SecB n=1 Tax=Cecembia rubra TaxID=1485585 RepID=A0A2P8DM75_9BACT|nr:protein-export chaperone SecB [Cecembia rubra]PSK98322.1 preprotein translocase subunit SecB [Cecembia rubra]
MQKAAFSLERYRFEKVFIDFSNKTSNDLNIGFVPSGKFYKDKSLYELNFVFEAHTESSEQPFVKIECIAEFQFEDNVDFDAIPTYFYRNSIAILFPYIRAFIGTVTLQANIPPIVLPTMNLSSLEIPLRESTEQS